MDEKKKEEGFPYIEAPFTEPYFGQPEDCADLVNKYGTYNIQPTCEQENPFPMIAHGMPTQWKNMEIGKEELEEQDRLPKSE